EFESLLDFTGPAPRTDPWRRTSGIHKVRDRRTLARVRELWVVRDGLAQDLDVSPGRILRDQALLSLALDNPSGASAVKRHEAMRNSRARKHVDAWASALEAAELVDDTDLPPSSLRQEGPPPPR